MTEISQVSDNACFGGRHQQYQHQSTVLNCAMRFAIFLPPNASKDKPAPVLYWLSGLTCTDENFMQKAGAQRVAAELGIVIVAPDTSPRGEGVPDDPEGAYDLGLGAGFYLNATQAPWSNNYHMEDYILKELPALIESNFPVSQKCSISGHSMGGHGALTLALKNSERYCSVSAFSPISNPSQCPWGGKAFNAYLGEDRQLWRQYDSCELLKTQNYSKSLPALVDQGMADNFLPQLQPEALASAAQLAEYPLTLRQREGYDHSYFFVASFIEDHLRFHAKYLF